MRFKWWQLAIVVCVSIGFVVLLYVVAEVGRLRLVSAEEDVRRAQLQLTRVVDLYQLLMNAESGHRAYLRTGDPTDLEPFHRAEGRIDELSRELAQTYRGNDERVGTAIHQLGVVAHSRMRQMSESVAAYNDQGPAAGSAANSPSRHETMATFRELAGITRDYEQALMERSLEKWERELKLAGRLNLATLLLGLVLTVIAAAALVRNQRQRAETAADLLRQHDELKSQFDAQAAELNELARHLQHVQEEERARLSRGLHDELGGLLLAARMDVTWMQRHVAIGDSDIAKRLERLKQVLDQGIDLKRRVVEELRPTLLDTMGLLAALRWQSEETCKRADLRCNERFPDEEPQFQPGRCDSPVPGRAGSPCQRGEARQGERSRHRPRGDRPGCRRNRPGQRCRCRVGDPEPASIARHRRTSSPHPGARRPARHLVGAERRHDAPGLGSIVQRDTVGRHRRR